MFDIASSELLIVAIVALLVVGPKDLPKLMRTVGQWIRRARMMTAQFRAGFEQMMQEAEFQEERERIMRESPNAAPPPPAQTTAPAPAPAAAPAEAGGVQTFAATDGPLPQDAPAAATAGAQETSEAAAPAAAGDGPAGDAPRAASEQRL